MEETFTTQNPATGEQIAEYHRTSSAEIEATLDRSTGAYNQWRSTSTSNRSKLFRKLGEELERDSARASKLITQEMGKPTTQAEGEVVKCVSLCEYYADNIDALLCRRDVETEATASYVRLDPLGPILGIMPWNFPYWQVFRWGMPTLTAGNSIVLSHADNVQGTAEHIGELFARAEAPEGLFGNVRVANDIAKQIIEDGRIRGVSLTGSVRAGRAVGSLAAGALKPTVLELGGSDPCLILPDVDLEKHLSSIVDARFQNSGQTCVAAKRYLVHRNIADEFSNRLFDAVKAIETGDPTLRSTHVGPLARADLRDALADQVGRAVSEGIGVAVGGRAADGPGNFYQPTVLTGVTKGSLPFREELFGPVASICTCDSIDEMVELANATDYGLSASVWTDDLATGESLAELLDVGAVFVNQMVKSDMRLPFGGVKDSGYGRELGGLGVRQFANEKTVWIGSR